MPDAERQIGGGRYPVAPPGQELPAAVGSGPARSAYFVRPHAVLFGIRAGTHRARHHGMIPAAPRTERDPQTSAIIDAAIEVHRHLGRGFLEYVYRRPLELELLERRIPFRREMPFPIVYKGKPTGITFRADLVCYGEVIVELKAMKAVTGSERAQVINYLKAANLKRALLLNFGTPVLGIERFVNSDREGRFN
jgi:GxxExxY protein